jgi:uncharacterized membrane protein YeaQ/YmgE (transglycosylase-associated protein family)
MFLKYFSFTAHCSLLTSLSAKEVLHRVAANTEAERLLRFTLFAGAPAKHFEGTVSSDSFRIKRIINYRNSFLPVTEGSIGSFLGKTTITLHMRLMRWVKVFSIVWATFFLVGASVFIFTYSTVKREDANPQLWLLAFVPVVAILLFLFVARFSFLRECNKTKALLLQLLEAQESTV